MEDLKDKSTMSSAIPSGLYKKAYGAWAGFPKGHPPDHSRCCEEVRGEGRWPRYHQCRKKRGHGPEGAYCAQHNPAAVEARDKAARKRDAESWNKRRYEFNGRHFFDALVKIAEGHNDARGLAQEIVSEFKAGEHH